MSERFARSDDDYTQAINPPLAKGRWVHLRRSANYHQQPTHTAFIEANEVIEITAKLSIKLLHSHRLSATGYERVMVEAIGDEGWRKGREFSFRVKRPTTPEDGMNEMETWDRCEGVLL